MKTQPHASPSLLYRFLKPYVRLSYRAYYNRFAVRNSHLVPAKGPVIFAINHQNAFMDALAVAISTKRNPWFIARAGIFKSSTARFWLNLLQLLPIYRFRDGHAQMKKNDEAMSRVRNLLHENQAILIFPEGNHNRNWALRPLQKGIARMAFDFETETDWSSGLQIVPVGLQYEEHLHSHSELLVSYGKPIPIAAYQNAYTDNPARAVRLLLNELAGQMKMLMVHIAPEAEYNSIYTQLKNRPNRENNLIQRLASDQQFVKATTPHSPLPKVKPKTRKLSCYLLWPLFAVFILPHFPVIALAKQIIKKTVEDDHWTSSITFGTLILGGPLFYAIEALLIVWLSHSWLLALAFLGLIWPTGKFTSAFRYHCIQKS